MKKAFTLAETLIVLAIIGVVTSLTMPTTVKNYQESQYKAARLKALKTFGEAGKMISASGQMTGHANATDFVNNVILNI